ncbi:MAG: DUF4097 family beta strand repeat-containing protein [Candidatus Fimenecus sp.]
MKKAIIATAVVLVLSFISTVCFGVALGSQGLRAFFRDGGVLDEWSGAVSDWNDVILYTDALADTDERENLFSSEGTLLDAVDSLKITANCGEVRVLQGTGEQVEVSLEQYSSRVNPSPKYVLSVPQPGEIQLSAASDLDGVAAVLTVYVPKALTALTVEVRYGSVEIRDISVDRMDITLDAGDLDLAGCTLTTADLRVNTGDIEIEKTVTVTESLCVDCACGDVDIEIPETAPFTMQYTVQTGNAEIEAEIPSELLRTVTRKNSSCQGELQRAGTDGTAGAQYDISVNLGNLEIGTGTDFDD